MSVTVFVWAKRGNNVGHASLLVGTQYVSFWPLDEAGKKDVTLKRSHVPSFMPDYDSDCRAEGGVEARQLTLWSLNESAMLEARPADAIRMPLQFVEDELFFICRRVAGGGLTTQAQFCSCA